MLSCELYYIICSQLDRSTLLMLRYTSKHMLAVVEWYLLSKVANNPLFANMDKSERLRYLEQSRVISEAGILLSPPEVIPMRIYHTKVCDESIEVSFIDIDHRVFINGILVPDIQGMSLVKIRDANTYFIQGTDGLFYLYDGDVIREKPLSLSRISEIYALDYQGKILCLNEEDMSAQELESALPFFVDLISVAFLYNNHFLSFLIYLRDDQDRHWLMPEQDSRVWTLTQILREKKIVQVENCKETHEWKCFFHILFEDGTVEPMMVVIDEDDTITVFFRDIEQHDLVFCELRGEFLYDKQGQEYVINDNDEVEATGYTKWHSRSELCRIDY